MVKSIIIKGYICTFLSESDKWSQQKIIIDKNFQQLTSLFWTLPFNLAVASLFFFSFKWALLKYTSTRVKSININCSVWCTATDVYTQVIIVLIRMRAFSLSENPPVSPSSQLPHPTSKGSPDLIPIRRALFPSVLELHKSELI